MLLETANLTDVVSIAIRQADAHILAKQVLQIKPEVRVDEVSRVLERVVDTIATRVVERNTESILYLS